MNAFLKKILPLRTLDLLLSPLVALSSALMLFIRKSGVENMPLSKSIFLKVGVFPIREHYYEPLFNTGHLRGTLRDDRRLPGIDLNLQGQLELLRCFDYNDELVLFPAEKKDGLEFHYHNENFASGDAEYLYNIIRAFKPARIIEIGCGNSTLMAQNAVRMNRREDEGRGCEHICIEPYEMQWLEKTGVEVIRKRVEEVDKELFKTLGANDILFIDSSHVIRPQGDLVFEYLEVLPSLSPGVLVHIHDIFTPRDYPESWVVDSVSFWNEQYLLEAFLTLNEGFRVIGALNYLKHNFFTELSEKCPILAKERHREPGSFWIVKT